MQINIELDFTDNEILTQKFLANLCIKILELILHQRNQISLNYPTFKYIIGKWLQTKDNNGSEGTDEQISCRNFNIERQRNLAISTLTEIKNMADAINLAFSKQNIVKTIRFILGSTSTTPKEVFVIKLPEISKCHKDECHINAHDKLLKELLKNIITSEEMFDVFRSPMVTTNIFLDIEFSNPNPLVFKNNFTSKELIEFSPNHKEIVINLMPANISGKIKYDCCKELTIFSDIIETTDSFESDDLDSIIDNVSTWWEANYFIRGFKDRAKNFDLWQCN